MGGIDTKIVHGIYRGVTSVKAWQYFSVLVLSGGSAVYFLRSNNLQMVALRDEVSAADVRGEGTQQALENLHDHVFRHMNSDTGRIQLVQTYYGDIAESQRQQSIENGQESLYNEALLQCNSQSEVQSVRLGCITNYITDNAIRGENIRVSELPNQTRYTYEFVSPTWTPDVAGISLLIFGASLVALMLRLLHVRRSAKKS